VISLIIPYYKNIPVLKLILESLKKQSYRDNEAIVAEDDNLQETKDLIASVQPVLGYKLKHVHQQQDLGFRKAEILNKAVQVASGEILVFLDGDCIPHKSLLKQYSKLSSEDTVWFGRRVMLGKKFTDKFKTSCNFKLLNACRVIFSGADRKKYLFYIPFSIPRPTVRRGIWGCNWAIRKNTILKVNGFDEDYVRAGIGEDVDIEWRLRKNNCKFIYMPQRVIVYHLWHASNYSQEDVKYNFEVLKKKHKEEIVFCKNGLSK
jgi:cellulose synthase/poly-beta-1,6-N-acetylglucosamine synthase-like glycosyltransferase